MKVLGIDLAGSPKRRTGICIMNENFRIIHVSSVFEDSEIIEAAKKFKPNLVAIDAPLSLPKGRESLDKKSNIHFRKCDKELWKLKIRFFPITLGPMRSLTKRGIRLKKVLKNLGFRVIEVYPGATQDILGIPRKQKGREKLLNALKKRGIKGMKGNENVDELDAITAAYTGILYLKGKAIEIGDPKEGTIVIPKP